MVQPFAARRSSQVSGRPPAHEAGQTPLTTTAETPAREDLRVFAASPAMRAVVESLDFVARQPGGVILAGESGSGRRFLARVIHSRSPFADGPFIEVDCSAAGLSDRLFGCDSPLKLPAAPRPERSLASDAAAARRRTAAEARPAAASGRTELRFLAGGRDVITPGSLLSRARGGTILFTNLPEMPDRDQARLARLLRDGEVVIGSGRQVPLKVRPMAAVDASWEEAVIDGRVRPDLHRHIAAARIPVPPLRNRREDISDLAAHFIASVCGARRSAPKVFTLPAIQLLAALPYRGNVRELRLLVENLATHTSGRVIRLDTVLGILDFEPRQRSAAFAGTLREARARFEREYIIAMLEQHKGRPGPAAAALGIQRTNLYRKMRALGIRRRRGPTEHG